METVYIAEVLLCCSSESCRNAPRTPPHPPLPGDKGEMQVVPIIIHYLTKLSSVRLYLPKDIRSSDAKHSVRKAIQEVQKRFPDGLPLLDPIKVRCVYVCMYMYVCACVNVHVCMYMCVKHGHA